MPGLHPLGPQLALAAIQVRGAPPWLGPSIELAAGSEGGGWPALSCCWAPESRGFGVSSQPTLPGA